jgi:hypothetical protein
MTNLTLMFRQSDILPCKTESFLVRHTSATGSGGCPSHERRPCHRFRHAFDSALLTRCRVAGVSQASLAVPSAGWSAIDNECVAPFMNAHCSLRRMLVKNAEGYGVVDCICSYVSPGISASFDYPPPLPSPSVRLIVYDRSSHPYSSRSLLFISVIFSLHTHSNNDHSFKRSAQHHPPCPS